jgi:hypothetical protein
MSIMVSPRGKVTIFPFGTHARFSRASAHRLSISGYSCSGTGTYRWTIVNHSAVPHQPGYRQLELTKMHDACKQRVEMFAGRWF